MPTSMMCETRNRINYPGEGSFKEPLQGGPIKVLDQGHEWSEYRRQVAWLALHFPPDFHHPRQHEKKPRPSFSMCLLYPVTRSYKDMSTWTYRVVTTRTDAAIINLEISSSCVHQVSACATVLHSHALRSARQIATLANFRLLY